MKVVVVREVVERKVVGHREAGKEAASEYNKAATEYKERGRKKTTVTFDSGEKKTFDQGQDQSKIQESKRTQEEKRKAEEARIPGL